MNPQDMTLEKLLSTRQEFALAKEQMEAGMAVINEELLARLTKEKVTAKVVEGFTVSRVTRISFATTLAQAKELGAVKEAVDNDALKKLHYSGVIVPATKTSEYVTVRNLEAKDAETD